MREIFPTNYPPSTEIKHEKFSLTPGPKVQLERINGSHFHGSVIIEYGDKLDIKEWLLFHAFVFDETLGIDYYQYFEDGYKFHQLKGKKAENPVNYKNIAEEVYLGTFEEKPVIEYTDLFEKFDANYIRDAHLIKNYLLRFDHHQISFPSRIILSHAYWEIVVFCSIFEEIIGRPENCSETPKCSVCGKSWSHFKNRNEFISEFLEKIINSPKTKKDYSKIIKRLNDAIRNKTVHNSAHPQLKYAPDEYGNGHNIEESINNQGNELDLLNLLLHIKHVVRMLLLNRTLRLEIPISEDES